MTTILKLPSAQNIKHAKPWIENARKLENDPDNFDTWQELISSIKSLGLNRYSSDEALSLFRASFDEMLMKFPFCHGYWIIYATYEFDYGFAERAIQVYQRAVNVMPYCVDLWISYLNFFTAYNTTNTGKARALFEFASHFIGEHFLSHDFWSAYLDFETREAEVDADSSENRVFKLLSRIVRIPLHQYAYFFEKLRPMLENEPLDLLMTSNQKEMFTAELELEVLEDGPDLNQLSQDQKEKDMRERLISNFIEIYLKTQEEVARRISFEISIRRPFFHVAYVSESDVITWSNYLHFEEVNDDHSRIRLLYERALIPTALREDFWLRYARWLTAQSYISEARSVYLRAMATLPITNLHIRHCYAKFEASLGNPEAGNIVCKNILSIFPNSLETLELYAKINEHIKNSSGFAALNQLAWTATDEQAQLYIKLLMSDKYSENAEQSSKSFEQMIEQYPSTFLVWKTYLLHEILSKDHDRVLSVKDKIITSPLDFVGKKRLIHIYMAYLLENTKKLDEYFVLDKQFNHGDSVSIQN